MRRRNRHSILNFHTCCFIYLVSQSLFFFLVSIGMFVVEISLVKGRVVCIAFVFHIPVGFQIPVHDVMSTLGIATALCSLLNKRQL